MKFRPRRTIRALLLPLAAGLALTALPAQTAQAASTLTDGGFESDGTGAAVPAAGRSTATPRPRTPSPVATAGVTG